MFRVHFSSMRVKVRTVNSFFDALMAGTCGDLLLGSKEYEKVN